MNDCREPAVIGFIKQIYTIGCPSYFLIALAALFSAIQLQPQRSPASVEGVVLKLGTTEPLANANVQLNLELSETSAPNLLFRIRLRICRPSEFHRKATSDSNGRFILKM
jgi:hypothetical protein